MAYQIDPRKVAGVVVELNAALRQHGFNHGEVVVGLSELLGRVVVDAAKTQIQADELIDVAVKHMKDTVRIGAQVKDRRIYVPE